MTKLPKDFPEPCFSEVATLAAGALANNKMISDLEIRELAETHKQPVALVDQLFNAFHEITLTAIRSRVAKKALSEELSGRLKLRDDLASSLMGIIARHRSGVIASVQDARLFPKVVATHHRVDISLISSHLKRHMRPSVTLELDLSDGDRTAVELTVDSFDKLHGAVGEAIAKIEETERKDVFKIARLTR